MATGRGPIVLDGPLRMTGGHVVTDVTVSADTPTSLACPAYTVVVATVDNGSNSNPSAQASLAPCGDGKFLTITRTTGSACPWVVVRCD